MNKLVTALVVILVTLSIALVLTYPLLDLQNQNSTLQNQIAQLENEKKELENQIDELELQISELEDQIAELDSQIEDLEEQIFLKQKAEEGAVEITNVRVGERDSVSGLTGFFRLTPNIVYVTVKNYRSSAVDCLNVSISKDSVKVGYLRAGEQKNVSILVHTALGLTNENVATLWFNDVILDELHF